MNAKRIVAVNVKKYQSQKIIRYSKQYDNILVIKLYDKFSAPPMEKQTQQVLLALILANAVTIEDFEIYEKLLKTVI